MFILGYDHFLDIRHRGWIHDPVSSVINKDTPVSCIKIGLVFFGSVFQIRTTTLPAAKRNGDAYLVLSFTSALFGCIYHCVSGSRAQLEYTQAAAEFDALPI